MSLEKTKKNLISNRLNFVTFFCFLFFSIVSALFAAQTTDFSLEHLAFEINDYNKSTLHDETFKPSVLNIKADSNYYDLLNAFYYNSMNGDVRILAPDNYSLGFKVSLITQDTFSIKTQEEQDGGYRLDKGLYRTYFSDDILGARQYLVSRYDCDSFAFVSDSFADKLVSFYGITTQNPYETLIKEEKYCVLETSTNGGEKIKLCINNIVYTTKKQGARTSELYGDFVLVSTNSKIRPLLNFEFEVDLKDNTYCIKRTIKTIEQLGYGDGDEIITFKKYNPDFDEYKIDDRLSVSYKDSKKNDSLWLAFYIITMCLSLLVVCFLSFVNNGKKVLSALASLFVFLVYGIISNFVFVYCLFSVCPILLLLLLFWFCRKEVKVYVANLFGQSAKIVKRNNRCVIKI